MQKFSNHNDRLTAFEDLMSLGIKNNHLFYIEEKLNNLGFFDVPASTKYHGNYEGGLFEHSYQVTKELINLTEKLELSWTREMSPFLVGMFHDLCKCDTYITKDNVVYEYNPNTILTGHGEKSVIIAQQIMTLTEEEILCIRWHMGAYEDKSIWTTLGKAIEKYPNILYTHTADMIAARIKGV